MIQIHFDTFRNLLFEYLREDDPDRYIPDEDIIDSFTRWLEVGLGCPKSFSKWDRSIFLIDGMNELYHEMMRDLNYYLQMANIQSLISQVNLINGDCLILELQQE